MVRGLGYRWWIVGLLLLAAGFRFRGLFANSFHADEALFASFARLIATGRDPLLLKQWVDKPPLLFYLQAVFYPLLGAVEWAARMPNFVASLLLVPLTGRLVLQLYGDGVAAVLGAAVVALSPFTIQFSATAFTDPLLVMLLVATFVVLTGGRGRNGLVWAGVLFGLAAATKYQALLFLPLLIALRKLKPEAESSKPKSGVMGFLWGVVAVVMVVLVWDVVRTGGVTLWERQIGGYGGLRLAWSWELWPRLNELGKLWGFLLGSPLLTFGLVLAMPLFLALLIHDEDRPTALDQLFVLFLVAYILLHWLVAVPVWDRYMLPAVPVAAVVLGRFASRLVAFGRPVWEEQRIGGMKWMGNIGVEVLIVAGLIVAQLPVAGRARLGLFPIGGMPGADVGAAEVAAVLADAPKGTVLYDHWYSWQWRYHLMDSEVYVSWFAQPDDLVRDLHVFGNNGQPRWLVLPDGEVGRPVVTAVKEAGFDLRLVYSDEGWMVLYQVVGR